MVDSLEHEGTQDVSGQVDRALLVAPRRVAAVEHGMDDGADELGQTRVQPGWEAVEEHLGRVGGGWRWS